jgi:quercetin 2,3-dioxygenase
MITIRKAGERGRSDFGWLDSRHSFSFGDYHDPGHMGFRTLRVINDDRVAAGMGFGTHPHRDMEIVSYVLAGALEHRDSLGTGSVIRPGDVQRMSAGTGIQHSEFNHSKQDPVHFLQIWIQPERRGLAPGYEQKTFAAAGRADRLQLVASRDGREGSVTIHQDASLYAAVLAPGAKAAHAPAAGGHVWVQLARGSARLNGQVLEEGDGAAISGEGRIELEGVTEAELLLFDLA